MPGPSLGVILLAAGQGRRLPGPVKKGFRRVAGRPLYRHSLDLFARMPEVAEVVLVVPPENVSALRRREQGRRPFPRVVAGGDVRAESVRRGLAALSAGIRWVAVHDAARPCLSIGLVRQVAAAARRWGGAIPALPVAETLKRGEGGFVARTVRREGLWAAQTPQIFSRGALERAFLSARGRHRAWTDDARAFEGRGLRVRLVPGEKSNIKVTTREDLALAEFLLKNRSSRRGERPR